MTEYQEAVLEVLGRIQFFAHAGALGIAWIAGLLTWSIFVHGKNERDLW